MGLLRQEIAHVQNPHIQGGQDCISECATLKNVSVYYEPEGNDEQESGPLLHVIDLESVCDIKIEEVYSRTYYIIFSLFFKSQEGLR